MTRPTSKELIFIFRSSQNDAHTNTGLDAALLARIFEQKVSLLFMGEAVKLLLRNYTESRVFLARLPQLKDFGVKNIYLDQEALQRFPIDLLIHHGFLIPADRQKIKQLIHTSQTVSF